MRILHPISISEFNKNVSIKFKNILDGYDLYKNFEITGKLLPKFETDMLNYLNEIFLLNNNECYIDLYLNKLSPDEKLTLLNLCTSEDKNFILAHINLCHDNPYYKLTDKNLIPFLIRLNTREIFFVTFYFTHIPLTIWGNYNLNFPCFTNTEDNIKYYYNLASKNNLTCQ